jgi:hypothetical protein
VNETTDEQAGENGTPDVDAGAGGIRSGFDLFDHRGLLALVVLFGIAGIYTLVDAFFLLQYTALGGMPKWPFAAVAILTAPVAIVLGRGAPSVERYAVAALVVVAVSWAVYPAMLRVNALTGESESVAYRSTEVGVFEAPSGNYPRIDLAGRVEPAYWQNLGTDERFRFRLVRGSLGFYQLDLGPVYGAIGRFRQQELQ